MKTKSKLHYIVEDYLGDYIVRAIPEDNSEEPFDILLASDELLAKSAAVELNKDEERARIMLKSRDADLSTLREECFMDTMQAFSMHTSHSRDNIWLEVLYPEREIFRSKGLPKYTTLH